MANKTILSVFANDRFLETLHLPEPEADGGSLDMNELFPAIVPKNKAGKPVSIRYDLISVILHAELRKTNAKLADQENRIAALEALLLERSAR